MAQARSASFRPDLAGDNALLVSTPFEWPRLQAPSLSKPVRSSAAGGALGKALGAGDWQESCDLKEEEFSRAEALGLFDYLRKSRSRGFVVSLSGGADSAALACLVHLMSRFALDDIGPSAFLKKLGYFGDLTAAVGEAGAGVGSGWRFAGVGSGRVRTPGTRSLASAVR